MLSKDTSATSRWGRATAAAALAYCLAVAEGYEFSVFSTVMVRLQHVFNVERGMLGILAACHYWGMLFGGPVAGTSADYFGRKKTLLASCVIMVSGDVIMGSATEIVQIIVGRICWGFGIGMAIPVGSLYIVETAPVHLRGTLGAGLGSMISIGMGLGSLAGALLLDTWEDWRTMILIGCFMPLPTIAMLLLPSVPESPRWLVMRGDCLGAKRTLEELGRDSVEAESTIQEISRQLRDSHDLDLHPERFGQFGRLFCPHSEETYAIVAALGTVVCSFLSGIIAMLIYFPILLEGDFSPRMAVTTASVINSSLALLQLVGVKLPDLVGRRPLMLGGYTVIAVMYASLCWIMSPWSCFAPGQQRGWWIAGWMACGCAALQLSVIPVALFYPGEVLPLELRAVGMGVGNGLARFVAFLITCVFPSLQGACKWLTYLGFACMNLIVIMFMYVYIVETRGMDLEEIHSLYANDIGSASSLSEHPSQSDDDAASSE